jgi:hypothetical protein
LSPQKKRLDREDLALLRDNWPSLFGRGVMLEVLEELDAAWSALEEAEHKARSFEESFREEQDARRRVELVAEADVARLRIVLEGAMKFIAWERRIYPTKGWPVERIQEAGRLEGQIREMLYPPERGNS